MLQMGLKRAVEGADFTPMRRTKASWRAGLALAVLVMTVAGAGTLAAAAPIGAGSLSGRVVAVGGAPVAGICVGVDAGGGGTTTDTDGTYSVSGLAPGTYHVHFSDCRPDPTLVSLWYLATDRLDTATAIDVKDGQDTPLGDATMQPGVVAAGTVRNSGGDPVGGISVWVNATQGSASTGTQTATDGTYRTEPLPSGDYKVQFADQASPPMYAREYWSGAPTWSAAATLHLDPVDGSLHGGVDEVLSAAATVAGTVTDEGGTPLPGICVNAQVRRTDGGQDWINGTQTGSDGTFSLTGLPPVTVLVQFQDCGSGTYVEQWYSGAATSGDATPVVLAAGATSDHVDAQLATGVRIAGHVSDPDGAAIAGVSVNVTRDGGSGAWAQTDANGDYTTGAVAPGSYLVQFGASGSPSAWASQYWSGQPTRDTADPLVLTMADAPVRTGVDATLAPGATLAGTVTANGAAVPGECVIAALPGPNGLSWVAGTNSAADGTWSIGGLPAGSYDVIFQDCHGVGPYVDQWWPDAADQAGASPVTLAAGETRGGIDAHLSPAGAITGRVTESGGAGVAGVCVQASTDERVGGFARTDSDGTYHLLVAQGGAYRVQFVDCRDAPALASQWWKGAVDAAHATSVSVQPGSVVAGVDAAMQPGAPASVSGRVTNVGGLAMTDACVVVYLPDEYARFAPVGADGTFTVEDVPSGTYALAFLGCPSGSGDPSPVVADPAVAGVEYHAQWWGGAIVSFEQGGQGGPDPIAQGAQLVGLAPGASVGGIDVCFGCEALAVADATVAGTSITLPVTAPGLVEPGAGAVVSAAAAPSWTYAAKCVGASGGTARADGASSPLVVQVPGPGRWRCQVEALVAGTVVARSAAVDVTVAGRSIPPPGNVDPPVPPAAGQPAAGQPAADVPVAGIEAPPSESVDPPAPTHVDPSAPTAAALAFTGRGSGPLLFGGLVALLAGAMCLVVVGRGRARRF